MKILEAFKSWDEHDSLFFFLDHILLPPNVNMRGGVAYLVGLLDV